MKTLIKILIITILIIIFGIIYISYITDNNQQYLESITKKIKNNYNITENINYSNEYGNYYIIKTDTQIIVLSKDFQEILKEELSKLKEIPEDANIIYKTNKLMYEKTIREKKNITYEYYDIQSGELIDKTTMELK